MGISFNPFRVTGILAYISVISWLGVGELLVFGELNNKFWFISVVIIFFCATFLHKWSQSELSASFWVTSFVYTLVGSILGVIGAERISSITAIGTIAICVTVVTALFYYYSMGVLNAVVARRELEEEL